jgi:hypothetical protein
MLAREHSRRQYQLTVTDVPKMQRFELTLRSFDDKPMCIHIQRWPNQFGRIHFGSSWVMLHSAAGVYHARDENFGRCVGPTCIIHIAPKGILRGVINYSVFGSALDVAALKNRRLQVNIQPKLCTAPEFQQRKAE